MAIKSRSWFTQITGSLNRRGKRFVEGDRPDETAFQNLLDTSVLKSESDDRAKEDVNGSELEDIVGHVVAATDEQAIANQPKKSDRTIVVQSSQLPSVGEDSTESFTSGGDTFDGATFEVTKDENVTTRSNFLVSFTTAFSSYLNTIFGKTETAIQSVAQVESDLSDTNIQVAANTAAIDTLSGGTLANTIPVGAIMPYGGASAPSGWILLKGDVERDKVVYSTLYSLIGDVHGVPNDPANFIVWKKEFDQRPLATTGDANGVTSESGNQWEEAGKFSNQSFMSLSDLPPHQHNLDSNAKTSEEFFSEGVNSNDDGLKSFGRRVLGDRTILGSGGGVKLGYTVTNGAYNHLHTVSGYTAGVRNYSSQTEFKFLPRTLFVNHIMFTGV